MRTFLPGTCASPDVLTAAAPGHVPRIRNVLIRCFVSTSLWRDHAQAANPGALSMVMKSACNLKAFEYNSVTHAPPPPLAARLPQSLQSAALKDVSPQSSEESAWHVCPVCFRPLQPSRATRAQAILKAAQSDQIGTSNICLQSQYAALQLACPSCWVWHLCCRPDGSGSLIGSSAINPQGCLSDGMPPVLQERIRAWAHNISAFCV
jgi:hypothetical protein